MTDHSRAQLVGDHSHGPASAPATSRAARLRSFAVKDFAVPTGNEEEWRFSRIDDLEQIFANTPSDEGGATYTIDRAGTTELPALAHREGPRGSVLIPGDITAAVACVNAPEAIHIQIPAGTELTEPIRINVEGVAGKRSNSHIVIEALEGSTAVVVLEHTGSGIHAGNVESIVGDSAHLTVISLQLWDDDAVHVGQHEGKLGSGSHYKHFNVTFGGKTVRLTDNASYGGRRGEAELLGLYFADAHQHLEHQTYINHTAPDCVSRVTCKGALQGKGARSVWIGDVLIGADAEGTDTYELNRNLVLTEGAMADSVPNLEIETGEIEGAGHASATGRFDDEQLYYLMSRGIDEEAARKLVVRGFFAELVGQIGIPDIEERLMGIVEAELEGSGK